LQPDAHPLAVQRAARAGLLVAPVWFAANCTYNYGMSMTSITSSTVISSSSSAFTLLLSAVWLRERVTVLKLLGVALCWTGNALTAVGDGDGGEATHNATHNATDAPSGAGADDATFRGDAVCLLSALLYACYTTLIRRLEPPDLSLFFGFLGLATLTLFGPAVLLLHLSGLEDLAALTPTIFGLLVTKGLLDNVLSDYLWAIGVLLTSPTVATVGMSLTVPLAMLSDNVAPKVCLVHPAAPTTFSVLAAVAVVSGFVTIAAGSGAGGDSGDGAAARGDVCGISLSAPLLGPFRRSRASRQVLEPAPPAADDEPGAG
jgi:solute carrier family 35 protein F5